MKVLIQFIALGCLLIGSGTVGLPRENSSYGLRDQCCRDGKEIAAEAQKVGIDTSKMASANGPGISAKYTPAKLTSAAMSDKSKGFFAGVLELQVNSPDVSVLRSGKFNMYLKDEGGLKLYLESSGQITAKLNATESTPNGYQRVNSGKTFNIAFPPPLDDEKETPELQAVSYRPPPLFVNASFLPKKKKAIWIEFEIDNHFVWVCAANCT